MTEIAEINDIHLFDPLAFAGALVLGPVMVTLISGPLIIPIFALILGGPVYLIIGTPILLWMVGRFPARFDTYALAGFVAQLGLLFAFGLADAVLPLVRAVGLDSLLALGLIGLVFAPLWAGSFAHFYRRMNRMPRLFPQS